MANHALMCESLGVHQRQSKRSSYFEFDRAFIRDVQANLPEGKNATKMNIVLKKAEVLRPKKADTVNEIENRFNDWKEKQRYLEEVGEAPLKDDQKKTLLISYGTLAWRAQPCEVALRARMRN